MQGEGRFAIHIVCEAIGDAADRLNPLVNQTILSFDQGVTELEEILRVC